MIKLNSIDGEYLAVGRQTTETRVVLTPFGNPQQQSVNITGSGIQEVEFQDGFRMSIMSSKPMTVSTNVVNGVSTSMPTGGKMSVNNYRYLVTTNLAGVVPNLNQMMAVVQLPLNSDRLMRMAKNIGAGPNDTISLGISQRGVIQNPGGATGGSLSPQKRQKDASSSKKVSSTKSLKASKTTSSTDMKPTAESGTSSGSGTTSPTPDASAANSNAATTSTPQPANNNPQNPAVTQLLLSPTFTPVSARTVLDMTAGHVAVTVSQLDGEFIVTMGKVGTSSQAHPREMSSNGQILGENSLNGQTFQKQQKRTQAKSQTGLLITMAELKALSEQQKNGGMPPIFQMMDELLSQSGQSEASISVRRKRSGPVRMPLFFF